MAILFCTCKHEWQDRQYGKQQRVHNPGPKKGASGKASNWICTVCGSKK
jgi:hypothetical protein